VQPATNTRPRCRQLSGIRVLGTGSYVPEEVVTNEDLSRRLGCTPEWISVRTGIFERRYASHHQLTSDLCTAASRRCIEAAGVDPGDIDLLVLATCTPDAFMPGTGCVVQDQLGLRCPVVDLQAACAGFVYALVTAATYIASGASDTTLVVGGDCLSRACDPDDNMTLPLFGDGAGAVLLQRADPGEKLNFVLGGWAADTWVGNWVTAG
jgi:3-oxoacyl-[acyl-carrier-protein] synthase-3